MDLSKSFIARTAYFSTSNEHFRQVLNISGVRPGILSQIIPERVQADLVTFYKSRFFL